MTMVEPSLAFHSTGAAHSAGIAIRCSQPQLLAGASKTPTEQACSGGCAAQGAQIWGGRDQRTSPTVGFGDRVLDSTIEGQGNFKGYAKLDLAISRMYSTSTVY